MLTLILENSPSAVLHAGSVLLQTHGQSVSAAPTWATLQWLAILLALFLATGVFWLFRVSRSMAPDISPKSAFLQEIIDELER